MRAGDHGLCAQGRLQQIVPAAIRERAAHEHDVANGKERAQLTYGIEKENVGGRAARERGATGERKSALPDLLFDDIEPLGFAGRDQQLKTGMLSVQL